MAYDLAITGVTYGAGKFTNATTAGYGSVTLAAIGGNDYTIEAWVKTSSTVVRVAVSSMNTAIWLGVSSTGTGVVYLSFGSKSILTTKVITDNAYHHIEACFSSAGAKVFVDGVLEGSSAFTLADAGVSTSTANLVGVRRLGTTAGYDWAGEVDEVAIWNTARHSAGFTPATSAYAGTESNLLALYHFESNGLDSTSAGGGGATATTLTGPTTGVSGTASTAFTVGANGTITGTVVVTPSDAANGGTFSPTTVSISAGTPTGTFTYTPASTGAKTISIADNGGLTDATPLTYTATAAIKYTRVDATDTIGAQNIMVLVPSASAAIPYNASNPTPVVLYVHGAGESQTGLVTETVKFACRDALLDAGYILAGSAANGDNWGNQASVDAYVALEKYVRDNYNVKAVALWGQSMGGLDSLSAVAQGKIPVVGCLLTYPVCSLANLHSLGSYTGNINTAHGITGTGIATYANKTYKLDPALMPAYAFRDTPMRFYASAGDTVVPKANNTDVMQSIVASTRTEASVVVCTGNHGDASHFQPADYVSFFSRCFGATARTITVTLTSNGATPVASATSLKWAFWETATPGTLLAPLAQGTTETTDGSGVLVVTVTTRLASGATGWLIVTDSDGTTTQSPAHKAFSGPVVVS